MYLWICFILCGSYSSVKGMEWYVKYKLYLLCILLVVVNVIGCFLNFCDYILYKLVFVNFFFVDNEYISVC